MTNDLGNNMRGKLVKLVTGNALSKILGFVREMLVAWWFGTSFLADAYRVAQTVILLPTQLVMGSAFESAFVPSYKSSLSRQSDVSFLSALFRLLLMAGCALTGLFLIFGGQMASLLAPGLGGEALGAANRLVSVMSFAIPLYILTYFMVYALNARGRFGFGSVVSIVQNAAFIASLYLAYIWSWFLWIGIGFLFTFVCSFLFTAWALYDRGVAAAARQSGAAKDFRGLFAALWPLLLYMGFYQSNIFVERFVSSSFGSGSIAAIDYARLLFETPTFLIGIPVATLMLTHLSGRVWEENKPYVEKVLGALLCILLPVSILLAAKAELIVRLVYYRGSFDDSSLAMTVAALKSLSLSLWAFGLCLFLQRVYNAHGRNKEFLAIGAISVTVNIGLNLALASATSLGIRGAAFAFSCAVTLQACLLLARLRLVSGKLLIMGAYALLGAMLCYAMMSEFHSAHRLVDLSASCLALLAFWGVSFAAARAKKWV